MLFHNKNWRPFPARAQRCSYTLIRFYGLRAGKGACYLTSLGMGEGRDSFWNSKWNCVFL